MNAEHINPFIQGSQNILNTICNEKPSLGKVSLKGSPYVPEAVSIAVGINGELNGIVIFTMADEVAMDIASKLMAGMPVNAMDDMSISAVSELTNMISGNVATLFSKIGKIIDITPPKFHDNKTSHIDTPDAKTVCIPLLFQNGHIFEVNINIIE